MKSTRPYGYPLADDAAWEAIPGSDGQVWQLTIAERITSAALRRA
jgi:hypothetical protein